MGNDFEAIRLVLTERQIKLLGVYVHPHLYTKSYEVDDNDHAALLDRNLIEPVSGMWHKENFSGNRSVSPTAGTYRATDEGRAWFEWYDKQPKS